MALKLEARRLMGPRSIPLGATYLTVGPLSISVAARAISVVQSPRKGLRTSLGQGPLGLEITLGLARGQTLRAGRVRAWGATPKVMNALTSRSSKRLPVHL